MKAIKWVVLAAVLAGVVAFFAFRGEAEVPNPAGTLTTAEASRETIEINAEATGVLEPIRTVEVKSRASGEVLEVRAQTGDRVEQGALLAEIDPRDVENAYQQAVADLEAARVRAQTTGAHRTRLDALRKSGVITQQEFETAHESAASAKAALVRAQTNLQLAREQRADSTIRAPISGTIIERTVEPGVIIASATSNVSGGTTLFKMADLSAMQVRASIDEIDIGKVAAGQAVTVRVEAFPNRTFRGEVLKVEPQAIAEQSVTMFPVLVSIPNERRLLMPGMNAEVTIQVARSRDTLTVPVGAVVPMRTARTTARLFNVSDEAMAEVLKRQPRPGQAPGEAAPEGAPEPEVAETPVLTSTVPAAVGAAPAENPQPPAEPLSPELASQRPSVVFVQRADGTYEPRRVMIGLSDWDRAEVVSGLSDGEKVGLVTAVQLNQSTAERSARIRERMGGGPMGGAGGGPRRGR